MSTGDGSRTTGAPAVPAMHSPDAPGVGAGGPHGASSRGAFDTSALRADLKNRSVRSGVVNLSSRAAQIAIGIGGTMVLARLLRPADFGLYAMAGTLIAFVGSFRELGLPMAAMHREGLSHQEYSSLFWFYQKFNLLLAACMIVLAPVVARFYGQPELVAVVATMAVAILALGLSLQHEGLLKRQMRFTALTGIDVTASAIGVVAGIGAALAGLGYWALVIQFLTLCSAKSAGCWAVCEWRPSRDSARDPQAARGLSQMLQYGKYVTGGSLVKHLGKNLDRVLVGYVAGPQALGLYHLADKWAHFPVKQMYSPLRSVAVSGLSRVQDHPATYRGYVRRGLLPVFSVTLPAIAFCFVEAERIITLLLGSGWSGAIPLFRILCVAAFLGKITTVTRWLYLSSGRTARLLRWDIISTPIMILAVSLGAFRGATGVAIAYAVATGLLVHPSVWYCLRESHVTISDFIATLWRPAAAAIGAAAIVLGVRAALPLAWHPIPALLMNFLLFGSLYSTIWLALPGGGVAAREVVSLARALPRKRAAAAPVAI